MATVQGMIAMNDGMSPVIMKATRGVERFVERLHRIPNPLKQAENAVDSFSDRAISRFQQVVAAYAGIQGISWGMDLSDAYSQTNARLGLMNDGLQSVSQLQDEIFKAAQRTGQQYSEMTDFVAKLGMLSGNAFSSNRETIAFAEQISKHLKIAGTDAAAAQGAMLQLQQGLSMGVLRGQEFNSVMQGMPTVIQAIEEELGVTRRELREMANDGLISADIVKRAVFGSVDETNRRFESMPVTFGMAMNQIGNVANKSFQPVWEALGSIANNKSLQGMLDGLMPILNVVAVLIAGTIYNFQALAGVVVPIIRFVFGTFLDVASNTLGMVGALFSALFPIMIGLLAAYATYWLFVNAGMIAHNITTLAAAGAKLVLAAAIWTANAAVAAYNTVIGVYRSVMMGAIIVTALLKVGIWALASPILFVIGVVALVVGAFAWWMAAGGDLKDGLASAFEWIVNATQWMVNSSVKLINMLIGAYNKAGSVLSKVLGFEFTEVGTVEYQADFSGLRDKYAGAIREGTFLETIKGDLGLNFPGADGLGALGGFDFSGMEEAGNDTAKNTKGIKDSVDRLDEDIRGIRDLAEREYVREYRIAEVKVDMSNMKNTMTNGVEADDVVKKITESIVEAADTGAEGDHI
jgi:tape measure domain